MKRMIVFILCLFVSLSQAATYYLDNTDGDDSANGTSVDTAWKNWSKVSTSSISGDTIYVLTADANTYEVDWPDDRIYMADQVYQYGITWTFDANEVIGQFANRDFWAVGPINVTVISPAYNAGRNGSMINPHTNYNTGLDDRVSYNSSLNVGDDLPLEVTAGSSLISVESLSAQTDGSYIDKAAILTVLTSAPDDGSFRPPYFGTDKTIRFNVSDVNFTSLGTLDKELIDSEFSLSAAENIMRRPWISFLTGGPASRQQHPISNMSPYGRETSRDVGSVALMCQLDFTNEQKTPMVVSMAQLGIDWYAVSSDPNALDTWNPNGGHNPARKFPILFAGAVLDDPNMLAIGEKSGDYLYSARESGGNYGPGVQPPDYIWFQEDMQTFYVDNKMVDATLRTCVSGPALAATSDTLTIDGLPQWDGDPRHQNVEITAGPGIGQKRYIVSSNYDRYVGGETVVTLSEPWTTIPVAGQSQYQLLGYESHQVGLPEWGINYATNPTRGAPSWGVDYRYVNSVSWSGWGLAAQIMGLKEAWNHDCLFDYLDRWMLNSLPGGGHEISNPTILPFHTDMWTAFRDDYPPVWTEIGDTAKPVVLLSPANEDTDVTTTAMLTWMAPYPAQSYNVYLGVAGSTLSLLDATTNTFISTPILSDDTEYEWRVDAVTGTSTSTGSVWSFTTGTTPGGVVGSLADGLIGLWQFEDGAMTTDSVGGNTLTPIESPSIDTETYAVGEGSVYLSNSPQQWLEIDYNDLPSNFPMQTGSTNTRFTVSAWVRVDERMSSVEFPIASKARAFVCTLLGGSSTIYARLMVARPGGYRTLTFSVPMDEDKWYHIVWTYYPTMGTIRVWDAEAGDYLASTTSGGMAETPVLSDGDFYIGRRSSSFPCWVDNVAVWNRVLSSDEIDDVFAGSLSDAEPPEAPSSVSNPTPPNGGSNQNTSLTLSWDGSDLALNYDVYFGSSSLSLLENTSSTSVTVSGLDEGQLYRWRVDANGVSGTTVGPTWTFSTLEENVEPPAPAPATGVRVRSPLERSRRSDKGSARYLPVEEGLTAIDFTLTNPMIAGAYTVDEDLAGYLERIVILTDGDDTAWSLSVADSLGGVLFAAADLDMTDEVVSYDGQKLPFQGLVATITDFDDETTESIQVRFYVRETWRY